MTVAFFLGDGDATETSIEAIVIRDYIERLRSDYEREICSRYVLDGEELAVIADALNASVKDLTIDLRAALLPLLSN